MITFIWEFIKTLLELYQIIGVALFILVAYIVLFNHTSTFK